MKRVLKWIGGIVGAIVVVIVVIVAAIYLLSDRRMARHFDVAATPIAVPTGAAAIAEGHRLFVTRGCADCHSQNGSGTTFVDVAPVGTISGQNLTSGPGGIGGQRSDAELARDIRDGVGKDGRALIFMPATDFQHLTDADTGALIAFIRSLPPVEHTVAPARVGPILRLALLQNKIPDLVSAENIDHAQAHVAALTPAVTVEYGKYVANGCTGCHGLGFSGGPVPGGAPNWPPAKNLTPDDATGIGKWTEADFIRAIREGKEPSGTMIMPPMPWQNMSHMTDTELKALYAYLRTVPAKPMGNR
jgi:cytochrome c553